MVGAFAYVDADLGQIKPLTLTLTFTASLLDAQQLRESVENKPASLLIVPLGKALSHHFKAVDRWPATLK